MGSRRQTGRGQAGPEPGPPQLDLFDTALTSEEAHPTTWAETPAGTRVSFRDPSPHLLTVGSQTLEAYLRASQLGDVFLLRDVLRGLDYAPFFARYQPQGRQPYHPAVVLGLILFGLLKGIESVRKLERLGKCNVQVWWLTGGAVPDHSTLCRFFSRHQEELDGLFEQCTGKIFERLRTKGYDVNTKLAGDGTTFPALARRYRNLTAEAAREQAAAEQAKADRAAAKGDEQAARRAQDRADRLARTAEAADERTAARRRDRGKSAKPAVANEADPDAVVQKLKDGTVAPAYKPSVLADEHRLVHAHDVQPSNENASLPKLCEQAKRLHESTELELLLLDAGYFSIPVLKELTAQGVQNPLVSSRAVVAAKRKRPAPKFLPRAAFSYDPETDSYECPEGHELQFTRHKQQKGRPTRIYSGAPCGGCPRKKECTKAAQRTISRAEGEEYAEAMDEVLRHPGAKRDYAQRAAMVEPVFSDLRGRFRYHRFRRRGLAKVRADFALLVTAYNLQRLLDLVARAEAGRQQGGLSASGAPLARLRRYPRWCAPDQSTRIAVLRLPTAPHGFACAA